MDRMVLMRAFRQVEADFNSGNGLDLYGTRVDVSVGAMGIVEATLDFFCSHPRPLRLGNPEFQKKMVVWLQDAFDAGDITVDFALRRPSSTSSTSARSQAMAGGKRPASEPGVRHGAAASPKCTRRASEPSGFAAPSVAAPQAVPARADGGL